MIILRNAPVRCAVLPIVVYRGFELKKRHSRNIRGKTQ